jgi:hypothetical protein
MKAAELGVQAFGRYHTNPSINELRTLPAAALSA